MKANRFFKESGHPSDDNYRYELLSFEDDANQHWPKIYLDFSAERIKCYLQYTSEDKRSKLEDLSKKDSKFYEQLKQATADARPVVDIVDEIFTIRLRSDRDTERSLNHLIFEGSFADSIIDRVGSNSYHEFKDFVEKAIRHKLKIEFPSPTVKENMNTSLLLFYFFYEEFENTKLFRSHPDYDLVHQTLHNCYVYRAFLYKLKFLQYYRLLVAGREANVSDLFNSKVSFSFIEKMSSRFPFLSVFFEYPYEIAKNNKMNDEPDLTEVVNENILKDEFVFVLKEWTNIACSDEYVEKMGPNNISDKTHFFKNPEEEIKAITKATRDLSKILKRSKLTTGRESKTAADIKGDLLQIEDKSVRYLLKRYNVTSAMNIDTGNNKLIFILSCLCPLLPIFFSLALLKNSGHWSAVVFWVVMAMWLVAGGIFLLLETFDDETVGLRVKIRWDKAGKILPYFAVLFLLPVILVCCEFLIYIFWIGLSFCTITFALLTYKLSAREGTHRAFSSIIKLLFPRLLIAIISGWVLFASATEFISTEMKKEGADMLLGTIVLAVTWIFMFHEVRNIAPYYSLDDSLFKELFPDLPKTKSLSNKIRQLLKDIFKTVWLLFFSRITLVVSASFMISFYIGAFFHMTFISDIMQQQDNIINQFDEIKKTEEQSAGLTGLRESITNATDFLENQFDLRKEFAVWQASAMVRIVDRNNSIGFNIPSDFKIKTEAGKTVHVGGRITGNDTIHRQFLDKLTGEDIALFKTLGQDKLRNIDSSLYYLKSVAGIYTRVDSLGAASKYKLLGQNYQLVDSINQLLKDTSKLQKLYGELKSFNGNGDLDDIFIKIDTLSNNIISRLLRTHAASLERESTIKAEVEHTRNLMSDYDFLSSNKLSCQQHSLCKNVFNSIKDNHYVINIFPGWASARFIIFPRMLVYQALFAMFFGIFSQLVLQDKSITESL